MDKVEKWKSAVDDLIAKNNELLKEKPIVVSDKEKEETNRYIAEIRAKEKQQVTLHKTA